MSPTRSFRTHPSHMRDLLARPHGKSRSRRSSGPAVVPSGVTDFAQPHVPLPPPNTHLYAKQPGHTRKSLEEMRKYTGLDKLAINGAPHVKHNSSSTTGSMTPSSSDSPSPSECESWSVPSTQPPSRAPSMSTGFSGNKLKPEPPVNQSSKTASKKAQPPPTAPRLSPTQSTGDEKSSRKGPPSVISDGGGTKFTLKDLLGPKLVRRSSARSTASSKKSDSDRGGRSEAGASTVSLLKKYGVCEKVAIGKGATSVVRLAHKWDRSEEKLYAVKVSALTKWLGMLQH